MENGLEKKFAKYCVAWNYKLFGAHNKELAIGKGKTWSHATNWCLLFAVNVILNLCIVATTKLQSIYLIEVSTG